MNLNAKAIRREQFQQARHLHGGLWPMMIASLGIRLARLPIPSARLRTALFRRVFGKKYPPGINEQEADRPLGAYRSLNALFTRGIRPEFRPIPATTSQFLCPCDGTIQDLGRLESNTLLTLKGISYTLNSLLPRVETSVFENGHYAIIFLSPIDCHRVFSPQDGSLEEAIHVPGYRLPVHPPCHRPEFPTYTLNERMILRFTTSLGPCLVVMIAGWGVGNITLPTAPNFRPHRGEITGSAWPASLPCERGKWIATFELGSTAVLITPPSPSLVPLVAQNEKVKYGQPLFAVAP